MVISINQQFGLIVFSLVSGIITGIMFDFYRLIRGGNNPSKIIAFIEDTLFWILTAVVVFIFLLYTNYAYIGMYLYMWIIIGIYLYMKLASKIFISSQYKVLKFLGKSFRISINTILYPFQLLLCLIKRKNKRN
ncbi:spore cortex biosynthesis protein YabQ [Clostridiaceae bacterium UIB06]|uniref:Spore cortex biosynthesis protein YabQ n=1 Tax=Clostridium thailandense TaxID=2794346 RepID=A0A949X647_9CLOT|nr:spore cortex biosynthesis protein YabQ [Clostridium thailandense]MBV7276768.1 spore cortex biosynthesis protein YabQ [Clostridium thailandense]MCH5137355.1 spore cortex biosynthesis protein YabQ [Clostridiaceae bacterium UIB06]